MLTTETLFRISKEVGASVSRVEATVSLLEGGATVPFIARYRKEATGNLDEVKIQDIDECRLYYTALDQRRQAILASIEGQGKLTDELREKIQACFSKGELEDLYLPFKPKRRTKAGEALRLGLGPLADYIWEQTGIEPVGVYAERFVSPPEPKLETPAEVIVMPGSCTGGSSGSTPEAAPEDVVEVAAETRSTFREPATTNPLKSQPATLQRCRKSPQPLPNLRLRSSPRSRRRSLLQHRLQDPR